MKTLVLGMGNPILSDDAVGVRLATDFKAVLDPQDGLDIVEECSVGGLSLLDFLHGYQRAIVLDSLQTAGGAPGAWHRFTARSLRQTVHLANLHDTNFATALELGRRLGLPLPSDDDIHIFGIEIEDAHTFSECMTPVLERAYPRLVVDLLDELHGLLGAAPRDVGSSQRQRSVLLPASSVHGHPRTVQYRRPGYNRPRRMPESTFEN
jgi:hydrogenase maturation protease